MGIVNITPDSFSDGGKYFTPEEAIRRGENLIAEGADIIDLGAESTRPGATPISAAEEWARLEVVLKALVKNPQAVISVDTYHVETAKRALDAGAKIINTVYPEPIPEMIALCEAASAELVIPSSYLDREPGFKLSPSHYVDPMIGFNTTREEDLEKLRSIARLSKIGRVLVGASRKRIVKKLIGVKTGGKDIAGNLAIALYAANQGASCVRVHDVKETVESLKVWSALALNSLPQ